MGRPRGFDRDEVLDRAVELFWTHGYEGTSIADLEAGLGIGRQSLYNAFGDKQALFLSALDRYAQRSVGILQDLESPQGGLEAIRRYFAANVDFLTADDRERGCFIARSIVDMGGEVREVADRCQRSGTRTRRALRRALSVALERGEISRDSDVEALVGLLMTLSYGLSTLRRGGAGREEMASAVEALLGRL